MAAIPATGGQVKTTMVRQAASKDRSHRRSGLDNGGVAVRRKNQQKARSGEVRGRVWARSPMAGVYGNAGGTGGEGLTGVLLR